MPAAPKGPTERKAAPRIAVGRRVFLGMGVLGAAGIVFGAKVQNALGNAFGPGLGGLLPGANYFRLYTVSNSFPAISRADYRLGVSGLVHHPRVFTLDELEAMPSTSFTQEFQCVTGWTVPDVHWEGVRLSDILDLAGVKDGAVALTFESYDGTDTESLTLEQARLPEVIVAYRMLGAPVTTPHGGPVRLYVGPMFGYKSLKWLSGIRVVDRVIPGFWELRGYPVNGWRDGSTGPADPSLS